MVIAICDDEKILRDLLRDQCLEYSKEHNMEMDILEFASGEEVINYDEYIDLLLLDIQLPGMNGIEVKNNLIKRDNVNYIIFISGFTDRVWDAFSKKTLGFLEKPCKYEDICKKFEEYKKEVASCITVELQAEDGIDTVRVDYIICIRAQNVYLEVITEKKEYLIRDSLNEWEDRLDKEFFFRIHKSYLINMEYIKSIEGYHTILDNGDQLKIGRTKLKKFRNELQAYRRRNAH